jgi:glutathione peroxidase
MKRTIVITSIIITISGMALGLMAFLADRLNFNKKKAEVTGSIYDFKIPALDGEMIDFSRYKGKNLLIVNTASKCGYTPQYGDLEKLHEQYGDKVTILGFPANNFFKQEPGTNYEIANFCKRNYGVEFQMFEKVSVRGKSQHPLYRWLEAKSGKAPSWNFCKYLIDKNGNVVAFYPPKVNPLDKEIIDKISM